MTEPRKHVWLDPSKAKAERLTALPENLQTALLDLVDALGETGHDDRRWLFGVLTGNADGAPADRQGARLVCKKVRALTAAYSATNYKLGEPDE